MTKHNSKHSKKRTSSKRPHPPKKPKRTLLASSWLVRKALARFKEVRAQLQQGGGTFPVSSTPPVPSTTQKRHTADTSHVGKSLAPVAGPSSTPSPRSVFQEPGHEVDHFVDLNSSDKYKKISVQQRKDAYFVVRREERLHSSNIQITEYAFSVVLRLPTTGNRRPLHLSAFTETLWNLFMFLYHGLYDTVQVRLDTCFCWTMRCGLSWSNRP